MHARGPAVIASYLGLTLAQLREQLRSGKSLAQIATTRGKSLAGLENAIHADIEAHLDLDRLLARAGAAA